MGTEPHPFPPVDRCAWRGWGGSVAISLALHGLGIAMLLFEFGRPPQPHAPATTAPMIVELAADPSAPTTEASDTPDGPEQPEQEQLPTPVEKPPAFDPPPETKAEVADALPVRQPTPVSAPMLTPVRMEMAARATAPASAAVDKPSDTARALVAGASADPERAANQSWENQLVAHLQRYKRYPAMARALRQEDVIYLQFTIDRTGRVLSSRLARSRGHALLDAEVAALVRRASPLPAPPRSMGGATIEMVVPIEFYLRSPGR